MNGSENREVATKHVCPRQFVAIVHRRGNQTHAGAMLGA
jgi:hypothetical protein